MWPFKEKKKEPDMINVGKATVIFYTYTGDTITTKLYGCYHDLWCIKMDKSIVERKIEGINKRGFIEDEDGNYINTKEIKCVRVTYAEHMIDKNNYEC